MFFRIGDSCGTADKDGVAAVKSTDPDQPPDDVRQVASEHPTIHVEFVDNDIPKIHKKFLPFRVVRQDASMQHIGIGDHYMALLSYCLSGICRRISVIGESFDIGPEFPDQSMDFMHLILGQGLGGKHVQRPRFRFFEDSLKNGKIVAERFTARRRGYENNVFPIPDQINRLGLMAVKSIDVSFFQNRADPGMNPRRKLPTPYMLIH